MISTLKGWRPRPLDDGDSALEYSRTPVQRTNSHANGGQSSLYPCAHFLAFNTFNITTPSRQIDIEIRKQKTEKEEQRDGDEGENTNRDVLKPVQSHHG